MENEIQQIKEIAEQFNIPTYKQFESKESNQCNIEDHLNFVDAYIIHALLILRMNGSITGKEATKLLSEFEAAKKKIEAQWKN